MAQGKSFVHYASRIAQNLPPPLANMLRHAKLSVLNMRSREAVFSSIARNNGWNGTESVSGPGSTMEATSHLRAALPALLTKYGIRSVLDLPCGDAHWVSHCLPEGVDYIGADIVPDLIERNRKQKSSLGRFEVLDIVTDDLPCCDLVMVRDCLVHLPNDMAQKALLNIKRSRIAYLLTNTYPGRADNRDIVIGDYRPLDLSIAPFNLPAPLEMVFETEGLVYGKYMALWKVSQL